MFRVSNAIEKSKVWIKQLIQGPLFKRLNTRLLFTLTVLAALPLVIVGIFMTSVTREAISEYIKIQHQEIARRARNEVDLFIESPRTILRLLVETKDITEMNPFTQNLLLNKIKSTYPIFNKIVITDSLGDEITSSEFEEHTTSYQGDPSFETAKDGKSFFSAVKFNQLEEPYVVSSHPIRRFDAIVGTLIGEIDLTSIWNLVDEIKIGEQGRAFIISRTGELIAHPDKRKVIQKSQVLAPEILSNLEQHSETSHIFNSIDGEEMLGTFAYLQPFDWVVVIEQPIEEAYEVATQMLYQVFIFVGLVILVAILLAYLLEKRITAPINTLVDGVKRYGEGDLDFRIYINKYEEIAVLAEEFNAMAEKLLENQRKLRRVERLAAMSKFATLVSHEIRNPLNSMNINMQILKREIERPESDPDKMRKYYDIIISEIQRMDNLINNFLMISRPPRFDFLQNDLHVILDEVIFMHEVNARQQNVIISKKYCDQKILANIDRDQLKQVFHNIIINALQAMPKGGSLRITTQISKIKGRYKRKIPAFQVEFRDTGIGIPSERLKDIFEFYYTSKKTGTGLGLAIARQIVDGHSGTIEVDSTYGKGTGLKVNIPLRSQETGIKKERRYADLR